jgi:hypothetical protein
MSQVARKPLPSWERLNELFSYDPVSGVVTRKVNTNYNAPSGAEVGYTRAGDYLRVRLDGEIYLLHRIIWKIATGEDPDYVDHIDGNRLNNALNNLRSIPRAENYKNLPKPSDNTSGVIGVAWITRLSKWRASIGVLIAGRTKTIYLGVFDSFEDAVAARKAAEIKYGFHKNHGREAVQQEQGASA